MLFRHFSAQGIPIRISYKDLASKADLSVPIRQAFGNEGLGLCTISDIPNYLNQFRKVHFYSHKLANLPDSAKIRLESPETKYKIGWSRGKEVYNGLRNFNKGVFFARPFALKNSLFDSQNRWPDKELPEFKQTVTDLSNTINNTTLLFSKHLDSYVKANSNAVTQEISSIIQMKMHVAEINHYFPVDKPTDWSDLHIDNMGLVSLTCPTFLNEATGEEAENLDLSGTGLYVMDRNGDLIKIIAKPDELIVQIGEVTQLISGGLLQATPHVVKTDGTLKGVSRVTFVLFYCPDPDYVISCPDPKKAIIENSAVASLTSKWVPGITFKEFDAFSLE